MLAAPDDLQPLLRNGYLNPFSSHPQVQAVNLQAEQVPPVQNSLVAIRLEQLGYL